MAKVYYYLVESTYLVRWGDGGAEYYHPDGTWKPYRDHWDIATNGRYVGDDEKEALAVARKVFAEMREIGFEYP